jgi:S-disulfanyl-L-cysteine oxidoreductase SoxD
VSDRGLAPAAAGCGRTEPPQPDPTPTAAAASMLEPGRESWVIINELPEGTTQVGMGAEVYRLVCKICHGDRGQGLTSDWLAQINPEDRNCWQSKCHAENHPPDGFTLPAYVPPVVGAQIALKYPTAQDLYNYNLRLMPWQAPATMLDEEYWAVTAYLLYINGVNLGDTPLESTNAAGIQLR